MTDLNQISKANKTAEAIFGIFSERIRFRRVTNLQKLHNDLVNQNKPVDDDDMVQTFKSLEDAGLGALVIGRNGNPSRFVWDYNLKEVAKAALEGKPSVDQAARLTAMKRKVHRRTRHKVKKAKSFNAVPVNLVAVSADQMEKLMSLIGQIK